jgi:CopA family copper-resistance protein
MHNKHIKYIIVSAIISFSVQSSFGQSFNSGNNKTYTPFTAFAAPVADTTPLHAPAGGPISNSEKDIITKSIKGANEGIHFPVGTPAIKTVRYDLSITDTIVDYTGKKRQAIAVNGSIPAPTLVFTVGDTALIYVHNEAEEPTAIHWHGVFLPNRMDGVAWLTQLPIPPHTTYIYKFPVLQSGTYWYHSHYDLQEQVGLYGALIFNKRTEPDIPTIPIVLSDWSNTKPKEINRMLHTESDWFAIKKHSTQSYWEALKAGKLGVKFVNEWKRMKAMDVSDVYYQKFLLNGKTSEQFKRFKAGDSVRLRIVNGGSSTYFWITYSIGKMTVIANDGNDVRPVQVSRFIIAPSETYDVIVTIPENMQYELLATSEDRSGYASLWLGNGMKMPAPKLPKLNYFSGMKMMNEMMKMNGDMKPMGMDMTLQEMDMNEVMYPELNLPFETHEHHHGQMNMNDMDNMPMPMEDSTKRSNHSEQSNHHNHSSIYSCPMHPEVIFDKPGKCPKCGMTLVNKEEMDNMQMTSSGNNAITTLNYGMLESLEKTTLPAGPWKTLHFTLEGNMNRYVWTINNKTVSESDKILIKRGENLRIILHNNSMMRHPMHLHGHDFRLLNHYGEYSPMKNVVDILPMETDTLEFHASESGDWFFHCHILYHMMSGMGRIFSYEDSPPNPEIPNPRMAYHMLKMDDRMFFLTAENDFATNGNDGSLLYGNTRWAFQGEWRLGYNATSGYEVETHFGRYLGKMQWLFPYIGFDWRYRKHHTFEKTLFGQTDTKDDRKVLHVGVEYTLPWLIIADASVDNTGKFRIQLSRDDIPLTPRLRASFMVNTDREYMYGARYILTKNLALSGHYDSDMGWGVGVRVTY